jgi:hypothetical protein
MSTSRFITTLCVVAAPLGAVLATPVQADAVADFYKDKTVTVTVGYGPGGGADTFGRLLARHFGKHLPGKPTVIVQNMPGAGGKSAPSALQPLSMANILGYKVKVIAGYRGTANQRLAMERGEIEATCGYWASLALGPQKEDIASGKLVPIVQLSFKKHPVFGSAPLVYDLARNGSSTVPRRRSASRNRIDAIFV